MANAEQLKLLKTDIAGWNLWREHKPNEKIDLKEADLKRANLRKANLRNANLLQSDLSEADLRDADLRDATLVNADLREARLNQSHLEGADLRNARLIKTNLVQANLGNANLREADLSEADLQDADLRESTLIKANTWGANLLRSNLQEADLREADLSMACLDRACLREARLDGANLRGASLRGADLSDARLDRANLTDAVLIKANLREADLTNSNLVRTDITDARISKSRIYGVNVWDLVGEFQEQMDLVITPYDASPITVDNIKVAQFIYLIINNEEIRDVINTLTSKTVLILGRFAIPERKQILDTLRDKLRDYNLIPMVFDFARPTNKDFTETIKTLAGMSYFVIADVTNPKSSPLELQATIPDYQIPFVPIIQEGEDPFAMMVDLQNKYNWVLDTISYDSLDTLIDILKPHIIDPAIRKRDELRLIKAKVPTIISGRRLRAKKTRPGRSRKSRSR